MSLLFEATRIKDLELRNRIVRSATYDGCSERTGQVSEKQIGLFSKLADGGVGLIISGIMYVHYTGKISPFQNSIADDEFIPGLKRLTNVVHDKGAKIAVQLFHGGRAASGYFNYKRKQAIAPSFIKGDPNFSGDYRPMTEQEIREVIRAYGSAAKRAREAGFDAVQVHGAHGYLLSQFLSPYTNRRDDGWGGELEDRLRFHREVYEDIRRKVGEDFPVLIKIGVKDEVSGGLDLGDGIRAAQSMTRWGFDALEISQGLRGERWEGTEQRANILSLEREAYFRDWCREIKKKVDVPVMMVGGLRTFELMEEIIQKGEADFVSLCRPLIKEPGLIKEWEKGNRRRPKCISCNKCYEAIEMGKPLACFMEKESKTEI